MTEIELNGPETGLKGIKSRLENRQWPDAADAVTTLASYWTCKLNEPDVQTDVHVSFGAKRRGR